MNSVGMSRDRWRKVSAVRGASALRRTVFKSFWKEEKVALVLGKLFHH